MISRSSPTIASRRTSIESGENLEKVVAILSTTEVEEHPDFPEVVTTIVTRKEMAQVAIREVVVEEILAIGLNLATGSLTKEVVMAISRNLLVRDTTTMEVTDRETTEMTISHHT